MSTDGESKPGGSSEFQAETYGPHSLEKALNNLDVEAHFSGDFMAGNTSSSFYCSEINFNEISDTLSIASGISSVSDRSRFRRSPNPQMKGSVVRHVVLRQICSQLQHAFEVGEVGSATSLAVSTLVAVGTSNGVTFIFDSEQTFKFKLGASELDHGAVSSISFNDNCTRILIGHTKGHITMWDMSNGKLLRNIADVHTPNTGVIHVRFTDDPTTAICSDSGGSVFEINFKKILNSRSYESNCIFSGSRGEVCAVEPLRISRKFRGHPIENVSMIAMGTVTKAVVITIRPNMKVVFTHQLRAETDTIPILSWQMSFFQEGGRRVMDPILAFGRKSTIYLFRVHIVNNDRVSFEPLQQLELTYQMLNFVWVNFKTLAIIDGSENLRFLDVRSDEELESFDCGEVDMVYERSRYKGVDTGGNVSKAMAMIGERACFNTVACSGPQVFILGGRNIHVYHLRSWTDRVAFFSKQKLYPEALRIAIAYYNDDKVAAECSSTRVVEIITPKTEKTLAIVANKIGDLIEEFGRYLVNREGMKIDNLLHHFADNVPLCIHYSVILEQKYQILDTLYELFSQDPMALTVFLSSLQPYMSGGDLPDLNPVIVKDFVALLSCEKKYAELERSLIQLNITSMDIHQVMTICKENRMYDAIIHIHNRAMLDYTGPIEEMVDIIALPMNERRDLNFPETEVGNKLFVYISCCLAGASYPCGVLQSSEARRAKEDLVVYLTSAIPPGSMHSSKPAFYCLKTLLHFNPREFLNVLSLAFEDERFDGPVSGDTVDGPVDEVPAPFSVSQQNKQKIVDILLRVMVKEEGFETHEIGALFTFIARQMAKYEGCVQVDKQLFEEVVEYLTMAGEMSRTEERQQAMMELLTSGGLKDISVERLLEMAEPAHFYRVCEKLYEQQRRFDKVLLCYLNDTARRTNSFGYIIHILNSGEYKPAEKERVEDQVVNLIEELIQVNAVSCAALVIQYLPKKVYVILDKLAGMPETQYHFLEGAFHCATGETQNSISIKDAEAVTMSPQIQEKYVELKCMFDPDGVLPFLKCVEYFREHEVLEICREHDVHEATAYLLEKIGEVTEAFDSYKNMVVISLEKWIAALQSSTPPKNGTKSVAGQVSKVIYFLQRNCAGLHGVDKERLWFELLDVIMAPQKDSQCSSELKDITGTLLNSMMGYVAPHSILEKVMSDPVYNMNEFREVRKFIKAMIDTYNFERTMLATTNNLINGDLSSRLRDLKKLANRAIVAPVAACALCAKAFANSEVFEVIVFRCGHAYHRDCIDHKIEATSVDEYQCIKCNHTRAKSEKKPLKNRRVNLMQQKLWSKDEYLNEDVTHVQSTLSPAQNEALEHFKRTQKATIQHSESADDRRLRTTSLLSRDDMKLSLFPIFENNIIPKELLS